MHLRQLHKPFVPLMPYVCIGIVIALLLGFSVAFSNVYCYFRGLPN